MNKKIICKALKSLIQHHIIREKIFVDVSSSRSKSKSKSGRQKTITQYIADCDMTELRLHFGKYINIIMDKESSINNIGCCHYILEDILFHGRVTEQQIFDLFFQKIHKDVKIIKDNRLRFDLKINEMKRAMLNDFQSENAISQKTSQLEEKFESKLSLKFCSWMRKLSKLALNYVENPNLSKKHVNIDENKLIGIKVETMIRDQFKNCWEWLKENYFIQLCYPVNTLNKQENDGKEKQEKKEKEKEKEKIAKQKNKKENDKMNDDDDDDDIDFDIDITTNDNRNGKNKNKNKNKNELSSY